MGAVKPFVAAVVAFGLFVSVPSLALAQSQPESRPGKINQKTLGLMAADPQWLPQAISIATAVHHDNGLRVLPVVGSGTLQAVSDLAYLDQVDAALLPLDTLTYAQAQGLLQGLDGKFTYLARLQPVTWALIVPRSVNSLADLSGKRIATGPTGSTGFVAGELLFSAHGVSFARVARQNGDALAVLTQGAADAALVDAHLLKTARLDGKRYKLLPLPLPKSLDATYAPIMISKADAPSLVGDDADIETVAAPLAIVVFSRGTDKAGEARLKTFTAALLRNAAQLRINSNLAAEIPGWTRHRAAQDALRQLASEAPQSAATTESEMQQGDGQ